MEWQSLTREDCAKKLSTNLKSGLSSGEAEERKKEYGKNELAPPKKKSLLLRFLAQFSDFMIIILLIAAGISFVTSYLQQDNDYVDSIIILAIVVINAVIGLIQESRAEKAIEALKKLSSPQAHVVRSGAELVVPASELVPGDLVILKAGAPIPSQRPVCASLRCSGVCGASWVEIMCAIWPTCVSIPVAVTIPMP